MQDAAVAALQHMRQYGLRGDERTFEIDLIDAIEIGELDLMRLDVGLAGNAGAIDETVQLPMFLDHLMRARF